MRTKRPTALTLFQVGVATVLLFSTSHGVSAKPKRVKEPAPIAGQRYHLVKNWDFGSAITNRAQLDAEFFTRFIYNDGKLDTLNDEWERYRDNNNHVFADGELKLTARAVDGLKSGGIESGMLRSKWTGKYGYYECCMKVPKGRGMWPAFWINPQVGWPPEIDVLEIVDNGRDSTTNSFHYVHGKNKDNADLETKLDKWGTYRPGFDYSDDFHTFAVLWTPDMVDHYVDGVRVAHRRFSWTHDDGSDGGPAHVLLNLAVGGSWPGPPQSADEFPAELAVKYIRVWQAD
ncbi:glycoside hydrolase family 16 protein [Capsulimonas corticalis]|uniref:glycoside hydrolase family 16 protein n=1 Tax=Capsulimonas corticalis TaxID=2219043 RepID=UPI001403E4F1|nr:glycoside hydrolase family 16 protein [Capsulimonas corticalis]